MKIHKLKDKKTILLFTILLLCLLVLFQSKGLENTKDLYLQSIEEVTYTAHNDIEEFARQNGRYIAQAIGYCIKTEVERQKLETTQDMLSIINSCGAEHRSGGETGDFFVFDRISRKMIFDNSPDCIKGGVNRNFDWEKETIFIANNEEKGECWMHQDPVQCQIAIKDLYNAGNTNIYSKIRWQFDDAPERIESFVIPSISEGFNGTLGKYGLIDENNIQLQVAVGSQSDEVLKRFETSFKTYNKNTKYGIDYVNGIWVQYIELVILMCIMALTLGITIKTNK